MPELPDVENFKRVLVQNGLDRIIKGVVVKDARILGEFSAGALASHLCGRRLVSVLRHGKQRWVQNQKGKL